MDQVLLHQNRCISSCAPQQRRAAALRSLEQRGQRLSASFLPHLILKEAWLRQGQSRVAVRCMAYDSAARPSPGLGRSGSLAPSALVVFRQPTPGYDLLSNLREKFARLLQFLAANERLFVVGASTMIMSLSHTALRPVLPLFAKDFNVGAAAVAATISVYAVARLMFNVPAGMLGDRHGRKPLLIWGPAVTALGMIGCGLAGDFTQLLLWRWVTGVGSSLQMAGSQLFLADISQTENRARYLGTNQAASMLGGLVGPALGGLLADLAGNRAPFTLTGIAALLAALYGAWRLPETRKLKKEKESSPPPEQVPRDASAEVLTAAASTSAPSQEGSEASTVSTKDGKGKRRLRTPAWLQLLSCRDFQAISFVNGVIFMTMNGSRAVLLPLLACQSFNISKTALGLLFGAMGVVGLIGVMPASWVADHMGRKWTIVPSCLGLALALLMMAATSRADVLFMATGVYALANAIVGATPAAYAADVVPTSYQGFGLGVFRCAGDLGLMVGPAILGLIADASTVQIALKVNAVVLGIAVAYFGLVAKESRHIEERNKAALQSKLARRLSGIARRDHMELI
eukprot:jgi/Botrbrau1/11622/Bobra.0209s0013.1